MYEDQTLSMILGSTGEKELEAIRMTGTVNDGFHGDELDAALVGNGHANGHLSNGHVITTTQSDYQTNYEHTQTREEVKTRLNYTAVLHNINLTDKTGIGLITILKIHYMMLKLA